MTTWTTANGRIIPVSEMQDSHLINTIKFLQRRAFQDRSNEIVRAVVSPISYIRESLQDIQKTTFLDFVPPIYVSMVAEAKRKKLQYPGQPNLPIPPYKLMEDSNENNQRYGSRSQPRY